MNYCLFQVNYCFVILATLMYILGLSRGVSIYKMELPSKLRSMFTHFGHEAETADASVLAHSWHPILPKLLISTSSDSSLHAWQWKQDKLMD